jgi:hypothetical protein
MIRVITENTIMIAKDNKIVLTNIIVKEVIAINTIITT